MEIKPEHYVFLKERLTPLYQQRPPKDMLDRWEVLWRSGLESWACDTLYPYLKDHHIDNAMRQISREIGA